MRGEMSMLEKYLAKQILKLGSDDASHTKVEVHNGLVYILVKLHLLDSKRFNSEMVRANCMVEKVMYKHFPNVSFWVGRIY